MFFITLFFNAFILTTLAHGMEDPEMGRPQQGSPVPRPSLLQEAPPSSSDAAFREVNLMGSQFSHILLKMEYLFSEKKKEKNRRLFELNREEGRIEEENDGAFFSYGLVLLNSHMEEINRLIQLDKFTIPLQRQLAGRVKEQAEKDFQKCRERLEAYQEQYTQKYGQKCNLSMEGLDPDSIFPQNSPHSNEKEREDASSSPSEAPFQTEEETETLSKCEKEVQGIMNEIQQADRMFAGAMADLQAVDQIGENEASLEAGAQILPRLEKEIEDLSNLHTKLSATLKKFKPQHTSDLGVLNFKKYKNQLDEIRYHTNEKVKTVRSMACHFNLLSPNQKYNPRVKEIKENLDLGLPLASSDVPTSSNSSPSTAEPSREPTLPADDRISAIPQTASTASTSTPTPAPVTPTPSQSQTPASPVATPPAAVPPLQAPSSPSLSEKKTFPQISPWKSYAIKGTGAVAGLAVGHGIWRLPKTQKLIQTVTDKGVSRLKAWGFQPEGRMVRKTQAAVPYLMGTIIHAIPTVIGYTLAKQLAIFKDTRQSNQ